MRDGCAIEPAVEFQYIKTKNQTLEGKLPYRYGYYCPNCGSAHQIVENESTVLNEEGKEVIQRTTHSMDMKEFGASRRILNSSKPQNAFVVSAGNHFGNIMYQLDILVLKSGQFMKKSS